MPLRYADSSILYWLRVGMHLQSLSAEPTPETLYNALELYYLSNGLYDAVSQFAYDHGLWVPGMKALKNPAHRVVEFYAAKLWPGQLPDALPILSENPRIVEPIHQIWRWSNWSIKKQLAARWFALFGDWFIKVSTRTNPAGETTKVFIQTLRPQVVTDLDEDDTGYLQSIRLDIPKVRRLDSGRLEPYLHTEYWSKPSGRFIVWEHTLSKDTPLDQLPPPISSVDFAEEYGIDFVPVVHAKFRDIGEPRGMSAFTHALDKIDELNRMTTRLHQMEFRYNRPYWAVSAGGNDASGRPLTPPRIQSQNPSDPHLEGAVDVKDDSVFYLPGNASISPMVPQLDYSALLATVADQLQEIERDLPELAYYRLRDRAGDLSGRAVRLLLSDAVDRAIESRGTAEEALARAHAMALTIGTNTGLFSDIGTYEDGDFDHSFAVRPIIEESEFEKAETAKTYTDASAPLKSALRRVGWSQDNIDQLAADQEEDAERERVAFAAAVANGERDFDQGTDGPQEDNPAG